MTPFAAHERTRAPLVGACRPDFTRSFLPEAMARVQQLDFLSPVERLSLNQIRGHAYVGILQLMEEFIRPSAQVQAEPVFSTDRRRLLALLRHLAENAPRECEFRGFHQEFVRGFGSPCDVIGSPETFAWEILDAEPLAVAIALLHLEWMTRTHYVESNHEAGSLDPRFRRLLEQRWRWHEHHVLLVAQVVETLAEGRSEADILHAVEGYLDIVEFISAKIDRQVWLDLESLTRAIDRDLAVDDRDRLLTVQRQANRWTYLGAGLAHPRLLSALDRLAPAARERVEELVPVFS